MIAYLDAMKVQWRYDGDTMRDIKELSQEKKKCKHIFLG